MAGLATEPAGKHLSANEVVRTIRALTDAEKTKFMKIAMTYARRTPYGYEDLVQESMLRVLDGRRPWPRGLGAVPFLAGVARSITWDWRTLSIEEEITPIDAHFEERNVIAKIDTNKLIELFADDPTAETILEGMLQGARGEELQRSSGLNETEYQSKRVKIRRRIEKYFSSTWQP